jgi:Alg9-like mannosyltransferase family
MTTEERRFSTSAALAVVSCILVLLAVLFSDDIQHPDEHFQTMELASWKLGATPYDALPWEFEVQMRPWLQPAAYLLAFRTIGKVASPFAVAIACRASSAVLTIASNVALTRAIRVTVNEPRARLVATYVLWLGFWGPYLAVRTSSETTSAAFLGLGLGALILELHSRRSGSPRASRLLLVGLLLGMAFELRYQTGIMTAGVLAWLHGPGRSERRVEDLRRTALIGVGLGLAILGGTAVDRWGYGVWTFAPWNYLRENLLKGAAADFGTAPPFAYVWTAHSMATAVVTIPLFLLVVVGWIRGRRHVVTWAAVPFALVHCLLAHKETRFLFPLLGLAALHVGIALDGGAPQKLRRGVLMLVTWTIGATNAVACLASPFVLRFPIIDCERFLAAESGAPERAVLVDDPYDYGEGLGLYAWRRQGLRLESAASLGVPGRTWVVAKEPLASNVASAARDARVVHRTPQWRTQLGALIGGGRTTERWVVLLRE